MERHENEPRVQVGTWSRTGAARGETTVLMPPLSLQVKSAEEFEKEKKIAEVRLSGGFTIDKFLNFHSNSPFSGLAGRCSDESHDCRRFARGTQEVNLLL